MNHNILIVTTSDTKVLNCTSGQSLYAFILMRYHKQWKLVLKMLTVVPIGNNFNRQFIRIFCLISMSYTIQKVHMLGLIRRKVYMKDYWYLHHQSCMGKLFVSFILVSMRKMLIYHCSPVVVWPSHTGNGVGFFITAHWEIREYLSIQCTAITSPYNGVHAQLRSDEYRRNRAQWQACHALYRIMCHTR